MSDRPACSACEDRSRCAETFTCYRCGRELNACRYRVGGLDSRVPECVWCHERRVFGPVWEHGWSTEKTPHGERQQRLVDEAVRHQERRHSYGIPRE